MRITGCMLGDASGAGGGQPARQHHRLDGQSGEAPRGQGVPGVQT